MPQDELRLASNADTSGYLGETMRTQARISSTSPILSASPRILIPSTTLHDPPRPWLTFGRFAMPSGSRVSAALEARRRDGFRNGAAAGGADPAHDGQGGGRGGRRRVRQVSLPHTSAHCVPWSRGVHSSPASITLPRAMPSSLPALPRSTLTALVPRGRYEEMLSKMATRAYKSGDCVFRQGDPATAVYLVTAGEWEVGTERMEDRERTSTPYATMPAYTPAATASGPLSSAGGAGSSSTSGGGAPAGGDSSGGAQSRAEVRDLRVVARLGPGDHFGETALLEDREHRNTTVCLRRFSKLRHASAVATARLATRRHTTHGYRHVPATTKPMATATSPRLQNPWPPPRPLD